MTPEMKALLDAVEEAGSQQKLAEKLGVSQPFVNQMIHGTRAISTATLEFLGYEKIVTIAKKE